MITRETVTLIPLTGFEMFNRLFASWRGTSWEMSRGMENFIAGGMGSNLYWLMALRESPLVHLAIPNEGGRAHATPHRSPH
jgi:hypothetical protein